MKIAKIITLGLITISTSILAQNSDVPNIIENAFKAQHESQTITNQIWTKQDNGYKVVFQIAKNKLEYTYNLEGKIVDKIAEISKDRLNLETSQYINTNYSKAKIQTVYLQHSDVAPERIVVDILHLNKSIRLFFRPDGTFFEEVNL